jgi:ubiquinone/menaquinone biosynthesis C-methylase UbiE
LIRKLALAGVAAVVGAAFWWRKNPSACPYSQRFWVEAPHPFITRERLREILDPKAGERVLEVGPGTGYYALPVAGWLEPGGRLEVVDVQQEMLDHTLERAREQGIGNIAPTLADARSLPFGDDSFDAAYLVTVLGEIPDQGAALRELRRVVKPAGRIVVGELFGDPHMVTHAALAKRAAASGLRVEHRLGGRLWHFTRLGGDT